MLMWAFKVKTDLVDAHFITSEWMEKPALRACCGGGSSMSSTKSQKQHLQHSTMSARNGFFALTCNLKAEESLRIG